MAQCVALLPHSKKVVGSSPAWCNMSGLVPGPFCVEFACSPRVHPGSPYRTPQQQKHAEEQMLISPVPDQDRTGHLDLVPGRCILLAAHCSWHVPGGGCQDGIKAEETFHQLHLTACVCVCVCVSPLTLCVISACRVANKRTKCPLILFYFDLSLWGRGEPG